MAALQIVLSTVSAEFRSYRDALRHGLDRLVARLQRFGIDPRSSST